MLWLFSNKKRIYINYKANKSVCQLERLREISQQYSDHIACASEMASSRLCSLQSNPCLYLFWTKALHASQPSVVGAHLCWLWNSVTWLLWLHVAGKLLTAWGGEGQKPWQNKENCFIPAACCCLLLSRSKAGALTRATRRLWAGEQGTPFYPGCSNNSPNKDVRDVSIPKINIVQILTHMNI